MQILGMLHKKRFRRRKIDSYCIPFFSSIKIHKSSTTKVFRYSEMYKKYNTQINSAPMTLNGYPIKDKTH